MSPAEKIETCEVLETFCKTEKRFPYLNEGTFFYPTGALDVLDFFANWSDQEMLLISGDQGVSNQEQLLNWKPQICRHKTFSVAVNHMSLANFFNEKGGVSFLSKDPSFVFGTTVGVLGEGSEGVRKALDTVCYFEPKDYYLLVEGWRGNFSSCLELLKLGEGDPVNVYYFFQTLKEGLKTATQEEKFMLKRVIEKAMDHFFILSKEESAILKDLEELNGSILH